MSKVYMTIRTPYDDQANKSIKVFKNRYILAI